MQKDFHYNVIRILAEKSGFPANEAQIIAYASQYVDDATEFNHITIPECIDFDFERIENHNFNPICSAHKGLQFLGDFKKSVQLKIYFSFHFLPPEIFKGQDNYDYVTKPNSNFAQALMNNAINNFKSLNNSRIYNLIALGIAIHTYADTWAHQGFSGRKSTTENSVEKISIWENEDWDDLNAIKSFKNRLLPEIGHAEAYHYPDLPYIRWKYKKGEDTNLEQITRNNLDIYIDAAEKIYDYFTKVAPTNGVQISDFKAKLVKGLSYVNEDYSKREKKYKSLFPEIGFHYDNENWKNNVLNPIEKQFSTDFLEEKKTTYKWLIFHKAALNQRNFITKRIKPI